MIAYTIDTSDAEKEKDHLRFSTEILPKMEERSVESARRFVARQCDACDYGYQAVNRDIARAVLGQIEGRERPLVMLHDYHLYTAPGMIREERPDAFLHHFVHIPWSQPDSWRILPGRIREALFRGMLANDIIGFHTHAYCINFLRCCDELLEADVDYERGLVRHAGGQTLARAYPLSIDAERLRRAAESPEVAAAEREVLERRRKHLIIRVDRADLSKNVLRGFTAFDTFLTQHPEFREQVTFIAHLQPSRQDVPEYAEYLERIEALVAVVNHRHGTTDWMPIDLKIYENFPEAVARYKHFDLLMVNSLFDGMNLVAKEAPAVNTRDGVLMLSENTGSHEELADCALSVNPFDIQEQADAIYRALTMDPEERRLRAQHLKEIIFSRNPGDWVDDQLADIASCARRLRRGRSGGRDSAGEGLKLHGFDADRWHLRKGARHRCFELVWAAGASVVIEAARAAAAG